VKIEMKDNDALQIRAIYSTLQDRMEDYREGELLGLNVLKSLLKEKKAEIKKLNDD
jgi:hypothetical protein